MSPSCAAGGMHTRPESHTDKAVAAFPRMPLSFPALEGLALHELKEHSVVSRSARNMHPSIHLSLFGLSLHIHFCVYMSCKIWS